jgi:hypothetical protein
MAAGERYIRELVAGWPPLTPAQRERLAVLLGDTGGELPLTPLPPTGTAAEALAVLRSHPDASAPEVVELLGWPPMRARQALRRLVEGGHATVTPGRSGGSAVGGRRGGGDPARYRALDGQTQEGGGSDA